MVVLTLVGHGSSRLRVDVEGVPVPHYNPYPCSILLQRGECYHRRHCSDTYAASPLIFFPPHPDSLHKHHIHTHPHTSTHIHTHTHTHTHTSSFTFLAAWTVS
jgi:hypothetical protein